MTQSFPTTAAARPHAPSAVAGQPYSYDANGNLTTAEGRSYGYDAQNRLTTVLEGATPISAFAYDADGAVRSRTDGVSAPRRYVTPDYEIDPTGQPVVTYRFLGQPVARWSTAGLRYLLPDHLGSARVEVDSSGAATGKRTYLPYGGDRAISGAADLATDARYTSQRRADAGNGNVRRELYHYGARAYLPGVGVFTQPDNVVPDYGDPRSLNRYAYTRGNPVKYTDPTGNRYDEDAGIEHGGYGGRSSDDDNRWSAPAEYGWAKPVDDSPAWAPESVPATTPASQPIASSTPVPSSATEAPALQRADGPGWIDWILYGDGAKRPGPLRSTVVEDAGGIAGALLGGLGAPAMVPGGNLILSRERLQPGSGLERHETEHLRQAGRSGRMWVPVYLIEQARAALTGTRNRFEVKADDAAGTNFYPP